MLKSILLLILTFYSLESLSQTTVIAKIIDQKTIIIGADSRAPRVTYNQSSKKNDTLFLNHRKLYNINKTAFATIGNYVSEQAELAKSVIKNNNNLDSIVYQYTAEFYKKIIWHLNNYFNSKDGRLSEFIKANPWTISQTVFCGFSNDTPVIYIAQFRFKEKINYLGNLNDFVLVDTLRRLSDSAIICGYMDEVYDDVINNVKWNGNHVKIIQDFIKREAKANPKFVAEPIDVIIMQPKEIILIPKKQYYD